MSQAPTNMPGGLAGAATVGIADSLLGGAEAVNSLSSAFMSLSRNPIVAGMALKSVGDQFQRYVIDRLVRTNQLTGESEKQFRKQAEAMLVGTRTGAAYAGVLASIALRLADIRDEQDKLAVTQIRAMDMTTLKKGYVGRLEFARDIMRKEIELTKQYGDEYTKVYMSTFDKLNRRIESQSRAPGASGQAQAAAGPAGKDALLKNITSMSLISQRDIGAMIERTSDIMKTSGATIVSTTDAFNMFFKSFSDSSTPDDMTKFFDLLQNQIDDLGHTGMKLPEIMARTISGIRAAQTAGMGTQQAATAQQFASGFVATDFSKMEKLHAAATMVGRGGGSSDAFARNFTKMDAADRLKLLQDIVVKSMAPTTGEQKIAQEGGSTALALNNRVAFAGRKAQLQNLTGISDEVLNSMLQAKPIQNTGDFFELQKKVSGATGEDVLKKGADNLGDKMDQSMQDYGTFTEKFGGYVKGFAMAVSDFIGKQTKASGLTETDAGPSAELLGMGGTALGIGVGAYTGLKLLPKVIAAAKSLKGVSDVGSMLFGGYGAAAGTAAEAAGGAGAWTTAKGLAGKIPGLMPAGGLMSKLGMVGNIGMMGFHAVQAANGDKDAQYKTMEDAQAAVLWKVAPWLAAANSLSGTAFGRDYTIGGVSTNVGKFIGHGLSDVTGLSTPESDAMLGKFMPFTDGGPSMSPTPSAQGAATQKVKVDSTVVVVIKNEKGKTLAEGTVTGNGETLILQTFMQRESGIGAPVQP